MSSLYLPNIFLIIDRCAYVPTQADKDFIEKTLSSTKKPRELFRALILTKLWGGKIDEDTVANIYARIDKNFKENMIITATFFSQEKSFLQNFVENFEIRDLDALFLEDLVVRRNEGMDIQFDFC